MATKTLGTNSTTTLTALAFLNGYGQMPAADVAALDVIRDDKNNTRPLIPSAFSYDGVLYVPNRGYLQILPGDWVGVDSRGWPILLSADTIANGPWTHS